MKHWRDVNAIYQVYPRSFKDSDGDGIGDLKGITEKLNYLADDLGVEAVWISPFFPSPQADCGYDVSDYCDVDPMFGSMQDFDELLAESHKRGLKVMIDLVPNHTSDQHEWFKESRFSRYNPKRDWYVWRDQPNNWLSISGGSSWTYDGATEQYYLHSFMSSQPDLNWENPVVREAIKDVMRFWFDKGVDGFRVDAVWVLSKDVNFPDEPINPEYNGPEGQFGSHIHRPCKNGSKLRDHLGELAGVASEYDDKYLLFEFYPDAMLGDAHQQVVDIATVNPAYSAPFYFELLHQEWNAEKIGQTVADYLGRLPDGSKPTFSLTNHDQPRLISRYGEARARLMALLLFALPGLPGMYYGDEIGMENVDIPPELTKDKFEKTGDSGGRDPQRTPMQWDASLNGGFSSSPKTWLPLHEDFHEQNVASELTSPGSWLQFYKKLLKLRDNPVLKGGDFEIASVNNGYIFAFARRRDDKEILVLLNFADSDQMAHLQQVGTVILSTREEMTTAEPAEQVSLHGYEGLMIEYPAPSDLGN